jgi:hypothetical protein
MSFQLPIEPGNAAMKPNRESQASRKPVQSQRTWKAIAFGIVGKHLKPTIRVVGNILNVFSIPRRIDRTTAQPSKKSRQTDKSKGDADGRYHEARFQHEAVLAVARHQGSV